MFQIALHLKLCARAALMHILAQLIACLVYRQHKKTDTHAFFFKSYRGVLLKKKHNKMAIF